jgi:hypothetical protein
MGMAVVMDGAITADAGIITGGVMATTTGGGITAITGDLIPESLAQAGTAMAHMPPACRRDTSRSLSNTGEVHQARN